MAAKGEANAPGRLLFGGTYSFRTRNSINAPQGTFNLTISETPTGTDAVGNIEIATLWGDTTHTSLNYHGTAKFNGSQGYTIVNGVGKGIMTYDGNKKRPIVANMNIALQPGLRQGEVSIQGFGEDMPCILTREWMNNVK